MSSGLVVVTLILYGGHSVHVAVAEFHDSHKFVLPFRFPHPRSDLFEKCSHAPGACRNCFC